MEFQENTVEAIEDGRIVRVSESYARREGLPILRRSAAAEAAAQQQRRPLPADKAKRIQSEFKPDLMDALKRKPSWKEKQVLSELIENFNWVIKNERMKKGLSRKQLAQMINEKEENIKLLEYGALPADDFVLINKVQQALKVNLRKDGKDFSQPLSELMKKTEDRNRRASVLEQLKKQKEERFKTSVSGSEIEILDDEI